ncbi:MAG: hypothetical protein J6T94_01595 [Bacteroidaceae bacterium]|nr:hypothetical protein [Bacteroidaceae bacterium]
MIRPPRTFVTALACIDSFCHMSVQGGIRVDHVCLAAKPARHGQKK